MLGGSTTNVVEPPVLAAQTSAMMKVTVSILSRRQSWGDS
jgi:hypothetical protein